MNTYLYTETQETVKDGKTKRSHSIHGSVILPGGGVVIYGGGVRLRFSQHLREPCSWPVNTTAYRSSGVNREGTQLNPTRN
ncbi:hypothetical protein E2C01_026854 [Portunus trituberculatus]|uniref:Uncharacterized protein n=1 Tax=Portunus trituberculatus TaxID=210409 RepID=A0A5B7EH78_PORTR|nr:hypothetical protein [Portunus trituberculatus]